MASEAASRHPGDDPLDRGHSEPDAPATVPRTSVPVRRSGSQDTYASCPSPANVARRGPFGGPR